MCGSVASYGWAVCKANSEGTRLAPIPRHVYGSRRAAERALELVRTRKPGIRFLVGEVTISVSRQQ